MSCSLTETRQLPGRFDEPCVISPSVSSIVEESGAFSILLRCYSASSFSTCFSTTVPLKKRFGGTGLAK
jgi:hypothetical protein